MLRANSEGTPGYRTDDEELKREAAPPARRRRREPSSTPADLTPVTMFQCFPRPHERKQRQAANNRTGVSPVGTAQAPPNATVSREDQDSTGPRRQPSRPQPPTATFRPADAATAAMPAARKPIDCLNGEQSYASRHVVVHAPNHAATSVRQSRREPIRSSSQATRPSRRF